MKTRDIRIYSDDFRAEDLYKKLFPLIENTQTSLTLEIRDAHEQYRSADQTVLVAVVGLVGTALGAIITGILKVAAQQENRKIILESKNSRLEVPADISCEELDHLITKVKEMDLESISF